MKKILGLGLLILIECSCKNDNKLENTSNNPICKTAIKYSKEKTWWYDAAYYKIGYPNGDVPGGGACTDVVIRVLRANGMDLQQLIHEDMEAHFGEYPSKWGLPKTDPNIDHRRVPNIMQYFSNMGYAKPMTKNMNDYEPGDIICWTLSPGHTHIGILLNKHGDVYHNMGPKATVSEGFLFTYEMLGHYRIILPKV